MARTAALPVVSALTPPPTEASANGGLAYGGVIVSVRGRFPRDARVVGRALRPRGDRDPLRAGTDATALAARLEGTLTATLHADAADEAWAAALCDALADKTGRLVWNGYPAGVAVVAAMHHGGPWPASSSSLFTSVGTAAIRRFLRPVAYQNVPEALLPEALRAANPAGIQRNVDGRWTREPLA